MQIVIDIPEETIKSCKSINWANIRPEQVDDMELAIANGTVLPEHHGRLKDVDKIIRDGISKGFCEWYDEMKYAETIIPATKEKSCENCTNWNEHYGTITCMDCQNRSLWKPKQATTKEGEGE